MLKAPAPPPMAANLLRWTALALLGAAGLASITVLRSEWTVREAERALAQQDLALRRGEQTAAPRRQHIAPSLPPRTQMLKALYLARVAMQANPPTERRGMLDEASVAIERALHARPDWGEAWAVGAFIRSLREGPNAPGTRLALARSYAGAPYLRHAGQWRVATGLGAWSILPPGTRQRVIDEGVWLARTQPETKVPIFDLVRQTPAYAPFLLRWREMRAGDTDLDRRLGWERDKARERPTP